MYIYYLIQSYYYQERKIIIFVLFFGNMRRKDMSINILWGALQEKCVSPLFLIMHMTSIFVAIYMYTRYISQCWWSRNILTNICIFWEIGLFVNICHNCDNRWWCFQIDCKSNLFSKIYIKYAIASTKYIIHHQKYQICCQKYKTEHQKYTVHVALRLLRFEACKLVDLKIFIGVKCDQYMYFLRNMGLSLIFVTTGGGVKYLLSVSKLIAKGNFLAKIILSTLSQAPNT